MTTRALWGKAAVFFVAGAMATGMGVAQSTTEGAIAGTVEDPSAAVVPGAAITIHNIATNAEVHLTADSSGYFKAPLLEPGTYTVTVTAAGFSKYSAPKVTVEVGKLTEVAPHLATGAADTTTVEVSATQPLLNFESPDMNDVLDRKAVDDIPINNRRWSALALLTPGVTVDSSGYGLVQVRGISPLLNNVEIDGADDNQAYYSEERGRTREGYSTSANAVREFEVNTGVYSAQFGRAAGGVINSVTRSGANQLHGELFFNDLDRGFGAFVPGLRDANNVPLLPKDLRKTYGGSAGGAIKKDKIFWFYTYDQYTDVKPGTATAKSYGAPDGSTSGSFLEQPDATTVCGTVGAGGVLAAPTGTTSTHAALDALVCALGYRAGGVAQTGAAAFATGYTTYDNGLGAGPKYTGGVGLLQDLGVVPRRGYQEINTPKLDWQINDKNRASFVYHRLRWDAPGDVQTSATATYSVDAFGTDFVKLDYGVAKLESTLGSKLSNELLFQYGRELNDEGQQPYSAYTTQNLVAKGATASGLANGPGGTIPYINLNASGYGFNLGSPYYSYRYALPDERKWQIEDVAYYTWGNHSIRFGVDFVHNDDLLHQTPYYFGYYTYGSTVNYLSDLYASQHGLSPTCNYNGSGVGVGPATVSGTVVDASGHYNCYTGVTQDFGATQYEIATLDSAGFIQDNWKVTPRLTLELGLRYDFEALPTAGTALTAQTGTFTPYSGLLNAPSDKNNFGPRIGFAMDIFGNGGTVIRGGYGLYYGRILNGALLNILFGTGSPVSQYATASIAPALSTTAAGVTTYTANGASPALPFPVAGGAGNKPSSYFLSPTLQNPQVHEFDLQAQQSLGKGTVFQLSYLGSLGRELPNFLDVNLAQPTCTTGAPASASCVTVTVVAPTTTAYGTGPLPVGATYSIPTFSTANGTSGYVNPNFTNITELVSNVNSNYHAMTAEITNRGIHGIQFDANYTWAHALDFNQNSANSVSTNTWLNPFATGAAARQQNYGISPFNVGNRFAGYVLYTVPGLEGHGAIVHQLTHGWSINNSFQMQNGLPYSATLGSAKNSTGALNSGSWNGVPGVSYIPVIGLYKYQVPRVIVDDLRLQKAFTIKEKYELQLNADMYNVANHQNYSPGVSTDINTTAYTFVNATASTSQLQYQPRTAQGTGFQSHTTSNDSNFSYIPREFQIGARLEF